MKYIFIWFSIIITLNCFGQENKIIYAANVYTGIDLTKPQKNPTACLFTGYYLLSERISICMGTGVSNYENTLLPLYGGVRYQFNKHKFAPFVEGLSGYAFSLAPNSNGGNCNSLAFGIEHTLNSNTRWECAIGYEYQRLERLKNYESTYFDSEFQETLTHNSIVIKLGIRF